MSTSLGKWKSRRALEESLSLHACRVDESYTGIAESLRGSACQHLTRIVAIIVLNTLALALAPTLVYAFPPHEAPEESHLQAKTEPCRSPRGERYKVTIGDFFCCALFDPAAVSPLPPPSGCPRRCLDAPTAVWTPPRIVLRPHALCLAPARPLDAPCAPRRRLDMPCRPPLPSRRPHASSFAPTRPISPPHAVVRPHTPSFVPT
ncbi:hypothetical protein DENSPDRAFT_886856, partial [Dentipellis sp. KUC8613]